MAKYKYSFQAFAVINTCRSTLISILLTGALMAPAADIAAQAKKAAKPPIPVWMGADRRMAYVPDSLGNQVPDFSYAGYRAGAAAIPDVSIKVIVPAMAGDATRRIQAALDYVASLPAGANGMRGAVLLQKGTFEVAGSLRIKASGVVLRGSGMPEGGTVVIGTGKDRETLVQVGGKNDRVLEPAVAIGQDYVPVGSLRVKLQANHGLIAGDQVVVNRPSTKEWIEALGTAHFGGGITALGWKAGQRDLQWDRTITAVDGEWITLDAPITTALDKSFGGGTLARYSWNGRIQQVGVENLQLRSVYDAANRKDEDHRWMAIAIDHVTDAWVRQVQFRHFAGSAVAVWEGARRVTVEDCKSLQPISEIGGQRRYTFFTQGQQTLFQRCYAEGGYHDFSVGYCTAGPNAFVQCESSMAYSFSGALDSWASGVLFDIVNVDGQALSLTNRGQDGNGAGWTAANCVLWQCSAARIELPKPPGAQNWGFGNWAQFQGDAYWHESNSTINPRSLYYAQLQDRLGAGHQVYLLPMDTEASSSPPASVAMELTMLAQKPALRLVDFIAAAATRTPITTSVSKTIKTIDEIGVPKAPAPSFAAPMALRNGWLVRGQQILSGMRREVPWWNGSARPHGLKDAKPHITRYVPGRTGTGLTDDLDTLTSDMQRTHMLALEHNYGLWYERRRDDHERIRRMDGEVWPPFYELPFARSGKGTAWDGLSQYDLTRYNHWYWSRLQRFATLADQKGLALVQQHYFQHNIIEAGAHYADFPWRTANNINNTGFPEPVPYAGDKRIFMAGQFYDLSDANRRNLHRRYIRQCLDAFASNNGVLHLIGAEFTGPLHFVQFWLDVVGEWEREKGKNALVGLSVTKDVQDAILADAKRAAVVDVIDIRYWHIQDNGQDYAPQGGQNLAPRQHARLLKPRKATPETVYQAVSTYKKQFPAKAVVYSGDSFDQTGWAAFMAGGSMANLPVALPAAFLQQATSMKPATAPGKWILAGKSGCIVYREGGDAAIDLAAMTGALQIQHIDPRNGNIIGATEQINGGSLLVINKLTSGPEVLWITRNQQL